MSDMEQVKEYLAELNEDTKISAMTAIKKLREENVTWDFINTALNIKKKEDWEKYGFGLFFTDSFKAQVRQKIAKAKELEAFVWEEDKPQQQRPKSKPQQKTQTVQEEKKGHAAIDHRPQPLIEESTSLLDLKPKHSDAYTSKVEELKIKYKVPEDTFDINVFNEAQEWLYQYCFQKVDNPIETEPNKDDENAVWHTGMLHKWFDSYRDFERFQRKYPENYAYQLQAQARMRALSGRSYDDRSYYEGLYNRYHDHIDGEDKTSLQEYLGVTDSDYWTLKA